MEEGETGFLERAYSRLRRQTSPSIAVVPTSTSTPTPTAAAPAPVPTPLSLLPSAEALSTARAALPRPTDSDFLVGRGPEAALDNVLGAIAPALNGQNVGGGGRYWGFVTGAMLPVAEAADNVASAYDQNVQVHLPAQSIATEVEDVALRMVIGLLGLDRHSDGGTGGVESRTIEWHGRTFTTGATASNILGLACGREAVIRARLPRAGSGESSNDDDNSNGVGELGLLRACARAGVEDIKVLASKPHSSVSKAASVVGLGRASVVDISCCAAGEPWRLDLDAVERELARDHWRVAHIIVVGAGEVNTGRFATEGLADMMRLRALADRYHAWIHVDGGEESPLLPTNLTS